MFGNINIPTHPHIPSPQTNISHIPTLHLYMSYRQLVIGLPKINNIINNSNFFRRNIKKCCIIDTTALLNSGIIAVMCVSRFPFSYCRSVECEYYFPCCYQLLHCCCSLVPMCYCFVGSKELEL